MSQLDEIPQEPLKKENVDLEQAATDFAYGLRLLASKIDNMSRGAVNRALISALKAEIDSPGKLIGEDERKLMNLISNMIKLRIVLYGEYLKSKTEDMNGKDEKNGEEKV